MTALLLVAGVTLAIALIVRGLRSRQMPLHAHRTTERTDGVSDTVWFVPVVGDSGGSDCSGADAGGGCDGGGGGAS